MLTGRGFGWLRDTPDFRDLTPEREEIESLLALAAPGAGEGAGDERTREVDLREFLGEVRDQQGLNASPAYACADLYEYFERRAHGRLVSLSRLFLYRNARALARMGPNAPVDLRSTLKALVTFGGVPLELWPDWIENADREPPPLTYAFARHFRDLRYVRLDAPNQTGRQTLKRVKAFLAAGFPTAFGFSVPNSVSRDGEILFRPTFDAISGGQAVLAVGYDDRRLGSTRGALLIRNSWSDAWGDAGHAWLPYAFVEHQLATDFWTLLDPAWLQSGELHRPRLEARSRPSAKHEPNGKASRPPAAAVASS